MKLDEALALPRVAICGGSKSGKTTLAKKLEGREIVHTDDFIGILPESGGGAVIADSLANTENFVLEGVKAVNALRAGLAVDVAIWLDTPHQERTVWQERQAKGVRSVWDEWVVKDAGRTKVLEVW